MMPVVGLFAVASIEVGLGAWVLARNPHHPPNRWFSALAGSLAVWGAVNAMFQMIDDHPVNLILARVAFATAALIPMTFYGFAVRFPHHVRSRPDLGQVFTLMGLFICGLAFSPWIVADVRVHAGTSQAVYGPLHLVFAIYFVACFGGALVHLARKFQHAKGSARVQLQYLFVGAALASVGGVTTNLLVPLAVGSSRFSVYGPYFSLIWVGFTAHAIIRHRLMDLRVVVSRSVAYVSGWALIAGLFVGGGVLFGTFVREEANVLSPAVSVLFGLVAGVVFLLLAPYMKSLADRYLYRPAYDAGQLVRDGTRAMATLGDPQRVAGAMADVIGDALQPESLAIVVWNRERAAYQVAHARHMDAPFADPPAALTGSSALVRILRVTLDALVTDDLAQRPPSRETAGIAADLQAWRAEVAVPVHGEGELIAIVLIGPKRSGDPFFREDFDLLDTLASQLAIGLQNAGLYQEMVAIKEYNERILARMDSGVAAVGEDGVVTTFNAAAERITGLGATQMLGESLERLDAALRGILRLSLAGQPDTEAEITVRHADGRTLPLVTHTSALHDRSGRVRGAIAVFNDHSRLKALEEDKRRADRLAAIGALATGIAHEIRNPLVAIKTFAELLPERADDHEFRSTFAKVASKEVHRIEELLGRLRALAVPAVAKLHPLDLPGPLAETLDLIRGEADRRGVRVVTEIEPELPPIIGEADQLKQLFLNVFLNGLDAMSVGGTLSVSVRADRERPERAGKVRGGLVTVRVSDTGLGIPREDLARIFEPFFTTKTQGTGLGLAICRGIADAHRAALWAEPGPAGVGTAFVVQFPAHVGSPVVEALR
jgi:PAS domain S-box-containing protein